MNAVAVIGLGAMGLGMARSLRRAGYFIRACDARSGAAALFAAEDPVRSTACQTPAEAVLDCPLVFCVVVNAAQTEAVLFGTDGAAAAMSPSSCFVMCSTVAPSWSEGMSRRLQDKGLLYLDAPISGGSAKAESGDITMMTSGPAEAYEVADQALQAMSSHVYRLGAEPGLGST